MIKKFMIIIILAFFMISAVSASDINETVNSDNIEIQIQEFVEVNQFDLGELKIDDVVENDVVSEEEIAPIENNQEYSDSYIINEPENYNEIENYQYNDTYIEALLNETLNNDAGLDFNNYLIVSSHIFNDFLTDYEVFICMELGSCFKTIDFGESLSEFKQEIDKFKALTHDDLIFYNDYYHILTHDVEKSIVLSNDKLHTKFAFSINNSIVGSAGRIVVGAEGFINNILNSNFLNFNLFSLSCFQIFSNFMQIFINFNYYEYGFFPSKTIE